MAKERVGPGLAAIDDADVTVNSRLAGYGIGGNPGGRGRLRILPHLLRT